MQTPSHFLLTAVLARKASASKQEVHQVALLVGSILPDLPLFLLAVSYEIYYRWFAILPTGESIPRYLYGYLFFNDPIWIISHNFFHSLVINTVLIGLGYWGMRHGWQSARPLFWLSIGTMFHTIVDILTHHSDGPLLFFPLNWHYRFLSPVSYWEAAYYGRTFAIFERTLDILIIAYFIWVWRNKLKASLPSIVEGE